MQIVEPTKDELKKFIFANYGSFQQSWQWGELQERMNRAVKRFLIYDKDSPQLAASFVRHDLPLGKFYWLCPRGPVFAKSANSSTALRDSIASLQNDKNCIFIRIEPELPANSKLPTPSYRLVKAPKDHSPRATVLVDLTKSESELLAAMHPKTRYNLRLAQKKELRIKNYELREGKFEEFWQLMTATARRGGFHLHPKKYYQELLKFDEIKLFEAHFEGKLVAAGMVSFWGNIATYLHGASDYIYRNSMAPYLLHWEIIKYAKEKGMKNYDFGGAAPRSEPKHPLQGVTRFKQGFGGTYTEAIGSWDYVLEPVWYKIYKLARKVL